ncbi:hypothetical protein ACOSP6_05255 [Tenacibaculum sp. MEBiC06402]
MEQEINIKGDWSFLRKDNVSESDQEWQYEEWYITNKRIYRFSYDLGERTSVYYKIEDGNLYVKASKKDSYSMEDLQGQIIKIQEDRFLLMNPYSKEFNRIEDDDYKLSDFLFNKGNSNERLKIDRTYTQRFFNRFNSIIKIKK